MSYFHQIMYLLGKTYRKIIADLFDLTRERADVPVNTRRKREKHLILDMDWYRWSLKEHEIREYLYDHEFLSKYADFIHIKREDVFKDEHAYPGVNAHNYRDISFEGFNLWGICKVTIAARISAVKPDPNNKEHFKQISLVYGSAAKGISRLKEIFDELDPDSVFICQGGVYDSRCVVEVARDRGINVVGIENSMIGGYVLLDNLSGQIINRHSLARIGSELLETRTISEEERLKAFKFWKENLSNKAQQHKTGGIDDEEEIRKMLNIDEKKKVLLLLGQVRTDASIILDSNFYDDPADMIMAVVDCVKHFEDTILVIRLHPKEFNGRSPIGIPYDHTTYKFLKRNGVDKIENVRIVEDIRFNTYSLIKIADAGITITSQAGMEMLLLGKPVMVCGNAFYGNKGFTVDLGHISALNAGIDHLVRKEIMSEEKKKMALDFFYLFCERHIFDHRLSGKNDRLARIFRLPVPL